MREHLAREWERNILDRTFLPKLLMKLVKNNKLKEKGGDLMGRIEKSIEIKAPVEKVFAFIIDFDNFVRTQPPEMKLEVLSRDEGLVRVGFTVKARAEFGGRVFEVEDETTELVKNKRFSGRQKGGAFKKLEHTDLVEPTESGTKYTSIMEYELPYSLLGKIIDKLKVQKDIEKMMDYSTKKTKELLEK